MICMAVAMITVNVFGHILVEDVHQPQPLIHFISFHLSFFLGG